MSKGNYSTLENMKCRATHYLSIYAIVLKDYIVVPTDFEIRIIGLDCLYWIIMGFGDG